MRDYIEITNRNNECRQVEIIAIFQLERYDYNYIIYKELDDYIARYKDNVTLDTNLSEQELQMANIFYEVVKVQA